MRGEVYSWWNFSVLELRPETQARCNSRLRWRRRINVFILDLKRTLTGVCGGNKLPVVNPMKICVFLLAFLSCVSISAAADEEVHHHEELTEAQVGIVHFPSSCLAAEQKPVERGVAMLHSFWYEEAEKQFQKIEKDDPKCAIAHWGVAMSLWHQLWNRPDVAVLDRGGAELKSAKSLPGTPREKDYIAALSRFYEHPGKPYQKRVSAYSKAMEKVYAKYPDDHEAAAFYALSLLAAEPDHDKANSNRKQAAVV